MLLGHSLIVCIIWWAPRKPFCHQGDYLHLHEHILTEFDKREKRASLRAQLFLDGRQVSLVHCISARQRSSSFDKLVDPFMFDFHKDAIISKNWKDPKTRENIKISLLGIINYSNYLLVKRSAQMLKNVVQHKKITDSDTLILKLAKADTSEKVKAVLKKCDPGLIFDLNHPKLHPKRFLRSSLQDLRFAGQIIDLIYNDTRLLPLAKATESALRNRRTVGSYLKNNSLEALLVAHSYLHEYSRRFQDERKPKRQKNNGKKGQCFYFQRFGNCNKGRACKFQHTRGNYNNGQNFRPAANVNFNSNNGNGRQFRGNF